MPERPRKQEDDPEHPLAFNKVLIDDQRRHDAENNLQRRRTDRPDDRPAQHIGECLPIRAKEKDIHEIFKKTQSMRLFGGI